jgi:pimeloyl-ACP methyl ester carboxylesterase
MYQTGGLLERLVKELPDTRFIGLDRRGEGLSSYKTKISSIEDHVVDVKEFLKAIGVKKVVFVGFCDSSLTGWLLSVKHPEVVEAVIVIGPVPSTGVYNLLSEESSFPKSVEDMESTKMYKKLSTMIKNKSKEDMVSFLSEYTPAFKQSSKTDIESMVDDAFKTRSLKELFLIEAHTNISSKTNGFVKGTGEIKSVPVKSLIILGEKDKEFKREDVVSTKEELPRGDLFIVKGAGKMTWLSDLESTVEPIRDVVSGITLS